MMRMIGLFLMKTPGKIREPSSNSGITTPNSTDSSIATRNFTANCVRRFTGRQNWLPKVPSLRSSATAAAPTSIGITSHNPRKYPGRIPCGVFLIMAKFPRDDDAEMQQHQPARHDELRLMQLQFLPKQCRLRTPETVVRRAREEMRRTAHFRQRDCAASPLHVLRAEKHSCPEKSSDGIKQQQAGLHPRLTPKLNHPDTARSKHSKFPAQEARTKMQRQPDATTRFTRSPHRTARAIVTIVSNKDVEPKI